MVANEFMLHFHVIHSRLKYTIMESVKELLRKDNLNGTAACVTILNTIIDSESPLSESDIKKEYMKLTG